MPSMRGISTSSVSTSGFRATILSRAIYGSGAVPTTSMPACAQFLGQDLANDGRIVDDQDFHGLDVDAMGPVDVTVVSPDRSTDRDRPSPRPGTGCGRTAADVLGVDEHAVVQRILRMAR